jgi:hypothetical protein
VSATETTSAPRTGAPAKKDQWWRKTQWRREPLPDGVLPPASRGLALLVGVVAVIAAGEAAYNLGTFVQEVLKLPVPLAIAFPLLAEAAAMSFALQDLADRRQGVPSRGLRAATYVTLAASAAVNGIVGFASSGQAGLLEILPPVVLGVVTHLHGERATRAWKSRIVLSKQWRAEQMRQARVSSVMDVLPLLTGVDEHGKATVALMRRRLEDQTMEPAEALMAAGWDQRTELGLSESATRRLEMVARTVWGAPEAPGAQAAAQGIAHPTAQRTRAALGTAAQFTAHTTAQALIQGAHPAAHEGAQQARLHVVDAQPVRTRPAAVAQSVAQSGEVPELREATDEQITATREQLASVGLPSGYRPLDAALKAQGLKASRARLTSGSKPEALGVGEHVG